MKWEKLDLYFQIKSFGRVLHKNCFEKFGTEFGK